MDLESAPELGWWGSSFYQKSRKRLDNDQLFSRIELIGRSLFGKQQLVSSWWTEIELSLSRMISTVNRFFYKTTTITYTHQFYAGYSEASLVVQDLGFHTIFSITKRSGEIDLWYPQSKTNDLLTEKF